MFNSQSSQDKFVLGTLDYKKDGYYLEIGCGHPYEINNSYSLELLGWKGISLDYHEPLKDLWVNRKNPFLCVNACTENMVNLLNYYNLPLELDYLSLDIDEVTNLALINLGLDKIKFKVITIEHDWYRNKDLKIEQRKILKDYVRICSDVHHDNCPFEDWYVCPELAGKFTKTYDNMDHKDIIAELGYKND